MKILHIINTLNTGGAERLLVDIASDMSGKGHDVTVFVLNPKQTSMTEELARKGILLTSFTCFYGEYNPLHIFKLVHLMKGYDVVHVHLFPSQYWAAIASLFIGNSPVLVTTEHSTGNSRARYKLTSWIDQLIYSHYDAIFCISQATKEFMQHRVKDPSDLYVIPNGIPVDRFRLVHANRKKLFPNIPESDCLLMQVARFGEQKNQACVIRALKLLPSGYHLVFVGSGIHEDKCKALVQELHLENRVTFLGDRADVPQLLSVADMVVMSSHWEGFGLSAAEAMAAGKIVLASDVPGLSQVVADPELRFEADNEYQLKELILKYSDIVLRKEKEEWGNKWVLQYDVKNTSLQYLRMYEYLLNQKNGKEKESSLL